MSIRLQVCCNNPYAWPDEQGFTCGSCGEDWWPNCNPEPTLPSSLRREAIDRWGNRLDVSSGQNTSGAYRVNVSIWGPRNGFHNSYEFLALEEAEHLRDKLTYAINHARWEQERDRQRRRVESHHLSAVLDWTS